MHAVMKTSDWTRKEWQRKGELGGVPVCVWGGLRLQALHGYPMDVPRL